MTPAYPKHISSPPSTQQIEPAKGSEPYRNGLSLVIDSISSLTPEYTHIGISSRLIHPLTTLVPSYCAEACLCPLTFTEISASPLWSWASQAAALGRLLSITLAVCA